MIRRLVLRISTTYAQMCRTASLRVDISAFRVARRAQRYAGGREARGRRTAPCGSAQLTAKRFYRERGSTCFDEHHLPSIGEWHGVQSGGQLGKNRLCGHTDESSNRCGRLFEPRTWGALPSS